MGRQLNLLHGITSQQNINEKTEKPITTQDKVIGIQQPAKRSNKYCLRSPAADKEMLRPPIPPLERPFPR